MKATIHHILLTGLLLTIVACSGIETEDTYPIDPDDARRERHGKITGEGGLKLFGGDDDRGGGGAALGVNSYLWRASLDTLSFMPLSSVDPRGGVIITEWYESPDARGEQFKINVAILDTRLRADGIKISVFKRTLDRQGRWRDAKVNKQTGREIEDKILTRAREMRLADAK